MNKTIHNQLYFSSLENKFYKYVLTAQSALVAETLTFPLDITKTRLQLQNELIKKSFSPHFQYRGMINMAFFIIHKEGITGLYQGLPPALLRHIVYSGIRIGIYEHIRDFIKGNGEFTLWKKALSGAISGAIGQFIASPTDLVKVRLQAQRKYLLESSILNQMNNNTNFKDIKFYNGTLDAFKTIIKEEGVLGLWKGVSPNVQRAALVNLGELATYDQSKELLLKTKIFQDNLLTHTIAGILSGLVASIVSCPADVVKTRMMNQYIYSKNQPIYTSSLDCFIKTIKTEGFFGIYKGFLPTWARLGPWQLCFWIVYEQLRKDRKSVV